MLLVIVQIIPGLWICLLKEFVSLFLCCCSQIRIAALNAASTAADESQDPLRSSKSQTKEAQVQPRCRWIGSIVLPPNVDLNWFFFSFFFLDLCPQEAEAFALYHKALDLQKHDKFEESAKAYHELLRTPLLKEVKYLTAYCPLKILMWFCVCGMWHLLNILKYLPQHTSFSQWGWSLLILHDIKKC